MDYKYKVRKTTFKFSRTGLFGNGDTVKVYCNGEYTDEFDLDDYAMESRPMFELACREWITDYGLDLIE